MWDRLDMKNVANKAVLCREITSLLEVLIPKAFSLLWGARAKCFNSLLIKIEVKEAL
jgi:hypothetical protein